MVRNEESKLVGIAVYEKNDYVEKKFLQNFAEGAEKVEWSVVSRIGSCFMEFGEIVTIVDFFYWLEKWESCQDILKLLRGCAMPFSRRRLRVKLGKLFRPADLWCFRDMLVIWIVVEVKKIGLIVDWLDWYTVQINNLRNIQKCPQIHLFVLLYIAFMLTKKLWFSKTVIKIILRFFYSYWFIKLLLLILKLS